MAAVELLGEEYECGPVSEVSCKLLVVPGHLAHQLEDDFDKLVSRRGKGALEACNEFCLFKRLKLEILPIS